MMGGGTGAYALHWSGGAARCVRSHIPGALSILKGAVPDRARGLGHMAPTYFRREPGIDALTAIAAPHLRVLSFRSMDHDFSAIADAKPPTPREAPPRRDGLPADMRAAAAQAIADRAFPIA